MRPVMHADCPRTRIRRAVRTPCQVVRERDFKLVSGTMLDLSVRGMLVSSELSILTGEELIVSFRSPTRNAWYDCSATVARVVHGRRCTDPRRAVGISFEDLDLWNEMLLCQDLRRAPFVERRRLVGIPRRA